MYCMYNILSISPSYYILRYTVQCTVQLKYTDIWIGMGEKGKGRRGEMSGGGEGASVAERAPRGRQQCQPGQAFRSAGVSAAGSAAGGTGTARGVRCGAVTVCWQAGHLA